MAGAEAYLHAKFHLDSSNRFASITNVTDRETGQTDNGMIAKGEPFYKRSPKKLSTPSRPVSLYTLIRHGMCSDDSELTQAYVIISTLHIVDYSNFDISASRRQTATYAMMTERAI